MSPAVISGGLQGKKILVVESEFLVPFTLYRAMEELGAEVFGPVAFADDVALLVGHNHIDGAILDSRMSVADRAAVHHVLGRLRVPFVEACGCMSCISGKDGCYRMSDAEIDLVIVGRALFGGLPSGSRVHRYTFASARRNFRPVSRGRAGARSTSLGRAPSLLWSNPH
jgi:hypothetical protein